MADESRNPDGTMKKGFTANPRGRPARSRNLITLFKQKRDEIVEINVPDPTAPGGKRKERMSRLEAWVTNLWNTAVACDPKASMMVLNILRAIGDLDPDTGERQEMNPDNAAVLEALIGRIANAKEA